MRVRMVDSKEFERLFRQQLGLDSEGRGAEESEWYGGRLLFEHAMEKGVELGGGYVWIKLYRVDLDFDRQYYVVYVNDWQAGLAGTSRNYRRIAADMRRHVEVALGTCPPVLYEYERYVRNLIRRDGYSRG